MRGASCACRQRNSGAESASRQGYTCWGHPVLLQPLTSHRTTPPVTRSVKRAAAPCNPDWCGRPSGINALWKQWSSWASKLLNPRPSCRWSHTHSFCCPYRHRTHNSTLQVLPPNKKIHTVEPPWTAILQSDSMDRHRQVDLLRSARQPPTRHAGNECGGSDAGPGGGPPLQLTDAAQARESAGRRRQPHRPLEGEGLGIVDTISAHGLFLLHGLCVDPVQARPAQWICA